MRKQEMIEWVESLPDEVDPEEIIYRLYLKAKLDAGEEDVRAGHLVPHEEVVARSDGWFK